MPTPTPEQQRSDPCGVSGALTSSNPEAKVSIVGSGIALTSALVGSSSQLTGSIFASDRALDVSSGGLPLGAKNSGLIYSSKATTFTGTCAGLSYNAKLEEGWNFITITVNSSNNTFVGTVSASKNLLAGMRWYYAAQQTPPPPAPSFPAGGAKLKLENWPAGQTGQLRATASSTSLISFPTTTVAGDGMFQYALTTPTDSQFKPLSCTEGSISQSDPAVKFAQIGERADFVQAFKDGVTNSIGSVVISNRQPTSNGDWLVTGAKFGVLLYTTARVKLTGMCGGATYDTALETGWNYLFLTLTEGNGDFTGIVTASANLPVGMNWYYLAP